MTREQLRRLLSLGIRPKMIYQGGACGLPSKVQVTILKLDESDVEPVLVDMPPFGLVWCRLYQLAEADDADPR